MRFFAHIRKTLSDHQKLVKNGLFCELVIVIHFYGSSNLQLTVVSGMSSHFQECTGEKGNSCPNSPVSTVSTGTQTPPSLLYQALIQYTSEMGFAEIGGSEVLVCPHTDWCQTGRELRQIADDLRRSNSALISSMPNSSAPYPDFQLWPMSPQRPYRRHSLADSSEYFRFSC